MKTSLNESAAVLSRRALIATAVACGLTVVPIAVLYALDVPLGQTDRFVYRYTPLLLLRWVSFAALVLPIIPLVLVTARLLSTPRRAWAGYLCAAATLALLIVWNYWAPPAQLRQHSLNFRSPSHDGAFVREAELPVSPGEYLRTFDQHIQHTAAEMQGTRVLANPPLMTLAFWAAFDAWPFDLQTPDWFDRTFFDDPEVPREGHALFERSVMASVVCAALLFVAGLAALGLGRSVLSPLGAFAFAVVVLFNPMTVHFNPGKDPDQLLTVCLMVWLWLAGWRRQSAGLSAAAGAMLMIGLSFGLIHLWVAVAAAGATLWQAWNDRAIMRFMRCNVLPATLGAVAMVLIVWLGVGWNMPATIIAVARRWSELQPELHYRRGLWLVIGLPIALAFVSPGLWLLAMSSARRWRLRPSLGGKLAICTVVAMAATYIIGIPYELPRLWVVFLPTLTLGLMMAEPLAGARDVRSAWRVIAVLLLVHILGTAAHWTFLDARESEYRLMTQRNFN